MDHEIAKTQELSLPKIQEIKNIQQATLDSIEEMKKFNPKIEKSFEPALKQIQADLDAYSKQDVRNQDLRQQCINKIIDELTKTTRLVSSFP